MLSTITASIALQFHEVLTGSTKYQDIDLWIFVIHFFNIVIGSFHVISIMEWSKRLLKFHENWLI